MNKIIEHILSLWPNCQMVNGKPRHSQSQGSVERANHDVEKMLNCWKSDNNDRG